MLCIAFSSFQEEDGTLSTTENTPTLLGFIDFLSLGFLVVGLCFILINSIKPYYGQTKKDTLVDTFRLNATNWNNNG
jgi:hypothetical protein